MRIKHISYQRVFAPIPFSKNFKIENLVMKALHFYFYFYFIMLFQANSTRQVYSKPKEREQKIPGKMQKAGLVVLPCFFLGSIQ